MNIGEGNLLVKDLAPQRPAGGRVEADDRHGVATTGDTARRRVENRPVSVPVEYGPGALAGVDDIDDGPVGRGVVECPVVGVDTRTDSALDVLAGRRGNGGQQVVSVGVSVAVGRPGGEATTAFGTALKRRTGGRQRCACSVLAVPEAAERIGDERPEIAVDRQRVEADSVGVGRRPSAVGRGHEWVENRRLNPAEKGVATVGRVTGDSPVEVLEGTSGSVANGRERRVHRQPTETLLVVLIENITRGVGGLEQPLGAVERVDSVGDIGVGFLSLTVEPRPDPRVAPQVALVHIDGIGDVLAETAGEPGREVGRLLAVFSFEGTARILVEYERAGLPEYGVGVGTPGVVGPDTLNVCVNIRADEEVRWGIGISDGLPATGVLTGLSRAVLVVVVVTRAGNRAAEQPAVLFVNLAGGVAERPGNVNGERPGDTVFALGGVTGRPVKVDVVLVILTILISKDSLRCGPAIIERRLGNRPAVSETPLSVFANMLNSTREHRLVDTALSKYGEELGACAPAGGLLEGLLLEFFPGGEVRDRLPAVGTVDRASGDFDSGGRFAGGRK